ncbi:hypothetical protein CHU95_12065 [Niveispirillum lacus]|uniref:Na+/H+ antiporter subunit E n=1 Tax=Niveispirillum lacus TaxID=1981099 RepID=A0A255YZU6_9PROT|nr:Na+/H+ antiporter subunit E [Niveispirillum lacus]OYQ34185.1 hypothetical protein CHU95_12065 [Niveispirillum lacus]
MNLLVVNLLLALAWMAVNASFNLMGFIAGFILGHLILWLARPLFPGERYFRRTWGGCAYMLWLVKEIFVSAWAVAKSVIGVGDAVKPAVIAIPLDAKTDFEITLLACSITLTPGTLSMDVSPDRRTLYIHAMFAADPDTVRAETKAGMERRILEMLR